MASPKDRSNRLAVARWCALSLCLALSNAATANLITNGDFQAGDTGFGSDYISGNVTGGAPGIGTSAGTYEIIDNPAAGDCSTFSGCGHASGVSYFDHTFGDGTGLMLAANGSTSTGDRIWFQDVALTASTNYVFSFWISSWIAVSPANLEVVIELGGQTVGTFLAPATAGVWQLASVSFLSDAVLPSPQTLTIRDLNGASSGNDFAIDDLSLVQVPEPATLALFALAVVTLGARRRS